LNNRSLTQFHFLETCKAVLLPYQDCPFYKMDRFFFFVPVSDFVYLAWVDEGGMGTVA
jgi:hypothetical protein